jgi:hypothetical protein
MGASLPTRIKAASMQWKHSSSPSTQKVTPLAGKVMLTVFWDSQGVLLIYFKKRGKNVYYVSCCEVLFEASGWNSQMMSRQAGKRVTASS